MSMLPKRTWAWARVSDQTVFLYHGEVIEADTTSTIFENPSKELTAEYLTGQFG